MGRWRVRHGVVLVAGIITAEDHLPRSSILEREAKIIKLHINWVIASKSFNREEVFDEMGRDEDVIEVEREGGCRYGGVTGVRYCKQRSVVDYYAV